MKQNHAIAVIRGEYFKIFTIFFILFAVLTKTNVSGWNDLSRLAQIQSIVEHSSFAIDRSPLAIVTGDKYFFNGHFYSDKPPILALYAVPFYVLLKAFGFEFGLDLDRAYYWLTLLSIGLLSILGLIIFRTILKEFFHASDEFANLITLITGAGTLILPYSLIFNNHVPSGVFILLGFYFLLKSQEENSRTIVYSGFFFSLAGSIDVNCFVFLPFMLIVALKHSSKTGLVFGIACLPMIALYLFLNFYTSGSLIPPAMNAPLWNYPGSSFNQNNLSGLAHHQTAIDTLFYAFHMLVGNRGLFSHTPILLFSMFGILLIYQQNLEFKPRKEYKYLALGCLIYIAFYILRTTNYSGWAFGIRWFASLMLILSLPLASLEGKIRSSKLWRFVFTSVACLSIFISIIGAYNPVTPANADERLFPTATIWVNFERIMTRSVILSTQPFSHMGLDILKLIVSGLFIYFLLYHFLKRFNTSNLSRLNG